MTLSPLTRRWLIRAAKATALALLAWSMHATLRQALGELERPEFREHLLRAQPGWLALSGLLYLLGMAPSALFFAAVMRSCRQPTSAPAAASAFYISQVGKYVPGKAMVIVLRAALLNAPGVERTVVVAAVFIDTLTTMACGALMACVALGVTHDRRQATALAAAGGMFVVTAIPALPAVFGRLTRLLGVGRFKPEVADKLRLVRPGVLVFGWIGCSLGWWVQGLSLWAALRAIGATEAGPLVAWPLHTAAAGLSVVAGFLTLIPAGFVGRELVLTQLMAPAYGAAAAALAAILLRLVWLVSESLLSIILYFVVKRSSDGAVGPAS